MASLQRRRQPRLPNDLPFSGRDAKRRPPCDGQRRAAPPRHVVLAFQWVAEFAPCAFTTSTGDSCTRVNLWRSSPRRTHYVQLLPAVEDVLNSSVHSFLSRERWIPEHNLLSSVGSRSRPLSHSSRPSRCCDSKNSEVAMLPARLPTTASLHQLRDAVQSACAWQSTVELHGEKALEGRLISGQAHGRPAATQHRDKNVRLWRRSHHPIHASNSKPIVSQRPRSPTAIAEIIAQSAASPLSADSSASVVYALIDLPVAAQPAASTRGVRRTFDSREPFMSAQRYCRPTARRTGERSDRGVRPTATAG